MKQLFLVMVGSLALLTGSLGAKSWTDLFKDFFYGPAVVAKADIFERDTPTEAQLASRPSDTHLVGKAANMTWMLGDTEILETGKRSNVTVSFTPRIGKDFKGVSLYFVLHKNDVNNGRPVYYEIVFGAEKNSCLIIKKGGTELSRVTRDQRSMVMLHNGQQQSWTVAVNMRDLIVYNVDQEVTEVVRITDHLPVKFVGYASQDGLVVERIKIVTEDKEPMAITGPVVVSAPVAVEEAETAEMQISDNAQEGEVIPDAMPEEVPHDDAAQEAPADDNGSADEATDNGLDQ